MPNALRSHPFFKSIKNRKSLTELQFNCYRSWQEFELLYDVRDEVPDAVADRLEFTRPEPPEDPRKIAGFYKKKTEQKFPYYSKEEKQMWESRMDEANIHYEKFLAFIGEEWRRRKEGFWFFNGGKLEYITGHHYMFLQYWMIPVAKDGRNRVTNADFRDVHRTLFYALDTAKNDNRCYGLLYYSMRRIGKSIVAASHGFFDTTAHREQKMTIQSKNNEDAKIVYLKLIESWKEVPAFFKPLDDGDSNPQTQLSFFQKKSKGKSSDREYSNAYLNGYIRHDSSKEAALDGRAFSYIIQDEVGKVDKGLDVHERWNISRECLAVGTEIIGFAYVTSTIEDFEKFAAKEAQDLWNDSDPINEVIELTDRTKSGLYRLFLPAYYGFRGKTKDGKTFVDEWGYSDIKLSYDYIKSQYEALKGKSLLSFRRKYPISIDDSFALTDSGNNFSKERLFAQKAHNNSMPMSPMRKGNFMWKNGVRDTEVVFYPDEDGKWEVSWMPPPNDRNKLESRGTHKFPTRDFGRMGVDTFDASYTRGEGSKAAAITIVNHPTIGDGAVVCTYLYRQHYAEDFFEDMIKQAVFYSTPVLIENNKTGLVEHFRKRNYNGFALKDPLETDWKKIAKPNRGIATTGSDKIQQMLDHAQAFIYDYIGLNQETGEWGHCPHNTLIEQCIRFEPDNRTEYDLVMALLMASTAFRKRQERKLEVKKFGKASDWLPTHNKPRAKGII